MSQTNAPAKSDPLKSQEWALVDDGTGGRIIRSGHSFAEKLREMECYDEPEIVLAHSKVGDVIKTGVSAYERIQ